MKNRVGRCVHEIPSVIPPIIDSQRSRRRIHKVNRAIPFSPCGQSTRRVASITNPVCNDLTRRLDLKILSKYREVAAAILSRVLDPILYPLRRSKDLN